MNKWIVGLVVLGALLMVWALGLQDLLTLSNVKTQQVVLGEWVSSEPVLSAIAFSLVYVPVSYTHLTLPTILRV